MNNQVKRSTTRSPNYPQNSLGWAIDAALILLEKQGLHAAHPDIIAQNLSYKDSSNGKARSVLASLKAFGLLEKGSAGKLSVSPNLQRYKLTPNKADKCVYAEQWYKEPLLYKKIIDKYGYDIPSDNILLFELVDEHGFSEDGATKAINCFRESFEFLSGLKDYNDEVGESNFSDSDLSEAEQQFSPSEEPALVAKEQQEALFVSDKSVKTGVIRYPVRLAGGRMACIEVPEVFYDADKNKLKAQLEIIGTYEDDNS